MRLIDSAPETAHLDVLAGQISVQTDAIGSSYDLGEILTPSQSPEALFSDPSGPHPRSYCHQAHPWRFPEPFRPSPDLPRRSSDPPEPSEGPQDLTGGSRKTNTAKCTVLQGKIALQWVKRSICNIEHSQGQSSDRFSFGDLRLWDPPEHTSMGIPIQSQSKQAQ